MVAGLPSKAARLAAALVFVLAAAPVLVQAELSTTAALSGTTAIVHDEEKRFLLLGLGQGRLDLKSSGNKNVKGQFQLDTLITDPISFDIPRAYLKVRFPVFRLTLGKTRVSWGEGFFNNAGDVVFDGMSLLPGLSASELRDVTDWMLVPYLSLGTFSYIEAILLPRPTTSGPPLNLPIGIKLHEIDVGARVQTKLLDHKLEAGYLYKGSDESHRPYASFKGNLFTIDWHLSTSLRIPFDNPDEEDVKKGWDISAGFFRSISLPACRCSSGWNRDLIPSVTGKRCTACSKTRTAVSTCIPKSPLLRRTTHRSSCGP